MKQQYMYSLPGDTTGLSLILIGQNYSQLDALENQILSFYPSVSNIRKLEGLETSLKKVRKIKDCGVIIDVNSKGDLSPSIIHLLKQLELSFVLLVDSVTNQILNNEFENLALKPLNPSNLILELDCLKRNIQLVNFNFDTFKEPVELYGKITLPAHNGFEFVRLRDIVVVIAHGNYSRFVLENGKSLLISATLKEVEKSLPVNHFFRTHRSFNVNINYVAKYLNKDGGVLVLENDMEISISRRKKEQFLKFMQGELLPYEPDE